MKKSKARDLLERLRYHKDEVLTSVYNFQALSKEGLSSLYGQNPNSSR